MSSLGGPWEGHPQGVLTPAHNPPIVFSRPRRFGPGKGTHKGCPYRLSSLGLWEGHLCPSGGVPHGGAPGDPQGVPLPIASSLGVGTGNGPRRAPTRGAPTDCQHLSRRTKKGCPYLSRRLALGRAPEKALGNRAPTRGAPTDRFSRRSALGSSLGVWPWEGRPQGVPLPIVFSRRFALRRDEFSVPAVRFVKSGQLQVIIFVLILLHGRPASARQFGRTLSANATCQRRKICKARHGAQS